VNSPIPPGPPPRPPADLAQRSLPLHTVPSATTLYRLHRTGLNALYFGRETDPARRQRWDSPNASYGVCYLAVESHIAFVETLLRDLDLDTVHQDDLEVRSLALVEAREPLRLVEMNDQHLRPLGADASVVQGSYDVTWNWSAEFHAHREAPDGIRYRARHDDSGFSVALFERASQKVHLLDSTPLVDRSLATELAGWPDRYNVGLTT
jgi:hypothetical protein